MAVLRDSSFRASSVVARWNSFDGDALAGRAGSVIEPRYPTGRHRGGAGEGRAVPVLRRSTATEAWLAIPAGDITTLGGVAAAAAIADAEVALAIRARSGGGGRHADQAKGRQEGGQGHGVHGEPSGAWWVGVLVMYNTKPSAPWAISHPPPRKHPLAMWPA